MNRRGLLSMVGGLALAAILGLRAGAVGADSGADVKAGCACCGPACACSVCTCDAQKAEAGTSCDCCGGATCCPANAAG